MKNRRAYETTEVTEKTLCSPKEFPLKEITQKIDPLEGTEREERVFFSP